MLELLDGTSRGINSRTDSGMSLTTPSNGAVKAAAVFNAQTFLESAGLAKTIVQCGRGEAVFTQGDACEHVMYVQAGGIKLSVLSKTGREAVVAMLGPGDFFGEGCLAGQPFRMGSATAIARSTILLVGKKKMDLIDQLFNFEREAVGAHAATAGPLRQADQQFAVERRAARLTRESRSVVHPRCEPCPVRLPTLALFRPICLPLASPMSLSIGS
jgi:CRP-like cAMP-binding protein